ncbi:MAG: 16S rRNA (guanine(527)-N(7))-methyltransferase RsmG [Desulfuromonadales bacterium]
MNPVIGDIVRREAAVMGLALTNREIEYFEIYAAELKKWNLKFNLTSIVRDDEIAIKHFIDSLHLVSFLKEEDVLLDIGSGAGLPVIPLKIVRPAVEMVSVDAVEKKVSFQRHVVRMLRLQKMETVSSRVEQLNTTCQKKFSLIVSRAFSQLDRFVSIALPLLADNGRLIAMKGAAADDEIEAVGSVLQSVGVSIEDVQRYTLPQSMGERVMITIKVGQAPLNKGAEGVVAKLLFKGLLAAG